MPRTGQSAESAEQHVLGAVLQSAFQPSALPPCRASSSLVGICEHPCSSVVREAAEILCGFVGFLAAVSWWDPSALSFLMSGTAGVLELRASSSLMSGPAQLLKGLFFSQQALWICIW